MEFREYWVKLDTEERRDLVERMGTSYGNLANLASGHKGTKCSATFAMKLEKETGGAVEVERTHPSPFWNYIRGTAKTKKKFRRPLKPNAARA